MNKASLFALEHRLELMSNADSFDALYSVHDFCRGFLLALLTAQVVSELEFDEISERVISAFAAAERRISFKVNESAFQLVKKLFAGDFNNEEPEQVSAPAASSGLRLCRLSYVRYDTFSVVEELQTERSTFPRLSYRWAPLPGGRSLVGGEGQVRLSSGQAPA